MKKILALLVALILVLSLAACGGGGEEPAGGVEAENQVENQEEQQPEETPEEIPEELAGTKTLAYFQKFLSGGEYTMEMMTTAEGVSVKTKNVYKGDMIYTESEFEGQKSIMVMRDGYQYIIDHATKTVMKMQVVDTAAMQELFADEAANYETAVATGTTEYNGKAYEYEEFTVEGETVQYLFDGDELKIMKATVMETESIMEILSIEKGADASLFEIPEDYQIIAY